MPTWVGLLRSANLGSNNRVGMTALRDACERRGFTSVSTYVQSGNVVFDGAGPEEAVRTALRSLLADDLGVPLDVVVRSGEEMGGAVAANPFGGSGPETPVHVAFLLEPPRAEDLDALRSVAAGDEAVEAVGRDLYLHLPAGVGRSKLAAAVSRRKGLGPATVRNWRTVVALTDLSRR